MSKKKESGNAVPVEKHLDQLRAMLEEAEIDFDEGSDNGITPFVELNSMKFQFSDDGSLLEVEND